MGFEKLSFPEAVRALAERLNIPLPQENESTPEPAGLSKGELIAAVEAAGKFYSEALFSPSGTDALEYARAGDVEVLPGVAQDAARERVETFGHPDIGLS